MIELIELTERAGAPQRGLSPEEIVGLGAVMAEGERARVLAFERIRADEAQARVAELEDIILNRLGEMQADGPDQVINVLTVLCHSLAESNKALKRELQEATAAREAGVALQWVR